MNTRHSTVEFLNSILLQSSSVRSFLVLVKVKVKSKGLGTCYGAAYMSPQAGRRTGTDRHGRTDGQTDRQTDLQ